MPTSEERQHRDAHAGEQPLQTRGAEDGGEEFRARAEPDGGEEKRDAEFAKGEVRIHRHVPDLPADAAHAAKDQRDDERAAGEAELERLRQAGKANGQRAERDAERDANEERNEMRFVEFLERVANGGSGFVEIGFRVRRFAAGRQIAGAGPARRTSRYRRG